MVFRGVSSYTTCWWNQPAEQVGLIPALKWWSSSGNSLWFLSMHSDLTKAADLYPEHPGDAGPEKLQWNGTRCLYWGRLGDLLNPCVRKWKTIYERRVFVLTVCCWHVCSLLFPNKHLVVLVVLQHSRKKERRHRRGKQSLKAPRPLTNPLPPAAPLTAGMPSHGTGSARPAVGPAGSSR